MYAPMSRKLRRERPRVFAQKIKALEEVCYEGENGNCHEEKPLLSTAIYARLSVEDGSDGNSASIENQICLLTEYVSKREDLTLAGIYIDNGATGTHFHRDGFQKLLQDIQRGKIRCLVIKDFSRLGRNFSQTGDFIERIFPSQGIRLISLGEGYDSEKKSLDPLVFGFYNLLNEFYARDISVKSKSALRARQSLGQYVSGHAPFGYQRGKEKYKLEIDKEAASVVKKIFQWSVEGVSHSEISRRLNLLAVPAPTVYRQKGSKEQTKCHIFWQERTISFLLQNPVYLGNMVYGKSGKLFGEEKRYIISPNLWNYVENTHPPLVAERTFLLANQNGHEKRIQKETNQQNEIPYFFEGKLYCGYCSKKVVRLREYTNRKKNKFVYRYRCNGYHGKSISRCKLKGRIQEEVLLETISILYEYIFAVELGGTAKETVNSFGEWAFFTDRVLFYEKERIEVFLAFSQK